MPKALETPAKVSEMKSIKNIYEPLCNKERIKEIIFLAAKHKKKRPSVKKVLNNADHYAEIILEMLLTGKFWQHKSHKRTITEKGKIRELTISPFFPNRILDYLVVEALKPYIKKSMYAFCIGNVDKRGAIYGSKIIRRKYKKYKYYIKLDIRKFYPSVKSSEMMKFIQNKVRDKRFLVLCEFVVCASDCLPIGTYYSQWLSNWFLVAEDHAIKEIDKVPFYVRYVDDMLFMGNNKRTLKSSMFFTKRRLKSKGLYIKPVAQAEKAEQRPIDFLGFRFGNGKVKLRLRNYKRLTANIKNVRRKRHICVSQARFIISRVAWLRYIDCGYVYYANKVKPHAPIGRLRRIISNADRTVLREMLAA